MKILASAYGEEGRSDFYSFVRSLDALKNSMKGEDKTVILSADSPIAQIFQEMQAQQNKEAGNHSTIK